MIEDDKESCREEVDPIRGAWTWCGCANHILNDSSKSGESEIDSNSIVMLLSRGARSHLGDESAYLIAAAPDLFYVVEMLLRFIEENIDSTSSWYMSDTHQIAIDALNKADGLYVDEEA